MSCPYKRYLVFNKLISVNAISKKLFFPRRLPGSNFCSATKEFCNNKLNNFEFLVREILGYPLRYRSGLRFVSPERFAPCPRERDARTTYFCLMPNS
jgi:hypothetical protein